MKTPEGLPSEQPVVMLATERSGRYHGLPKGHPLGDSRMHGVLSPFRPVGRHLGSPRGGRDRL